MIENDKQKKITEEWLSKFKKSLTIAQERAKNSSVNPRLKKACIDGIQSTIDDLEEELKEYKKKKDREDCQSDNGLGC